MKLFKIPCYVLPILVLISCNIKAANLTVKGVLDLRVSFIDGIESYANGNYGKFGLNNGNELSLGQLGGEAIVSWDSGFSAHIVANGYANKENTNIGFTEGFIKYRSVPNENGYRWQNRTGAFYPKISLENNAISWASKNTLNSSAINTWIGEEIRVLGSEFTFTRLGKFNNSNFDTSFSLTAFANNDPSGSLLSWHGWTIGNEQTLWTDSRPIAPFPARSAGRRLEEQADNSDPFLEVDDKLGFHTALEVKRHKKGHISIGYYHNNGTPYIVQDGQYSWRTQFIHAQAVWSIDKTTQLSAQYLFGDTLMQHADKTDAVNNNYQSGYIALSKGWGKHRFTSRFEGFSVVDNDTTIGDDNTENGTSITLNYRYRASKGWFLSSEYNIVRSYRPSRVYTGQSVHLTEQQLQLSARYFFAKSL